MSRSDYAPRLAEAPLKSQSLADGIQRDIQSGLLAPGERLPGTRTLAERLKLNRSTVVEALDDLKSQGWLEGRPGSGTFVTHTLPHRMVAGSPKHTHSLGFSLRGPPPSSPWEGPPTPGRLVLAGGVPDTRLVPLDDLARAYRRALRLRGSRLLSYGDPQGDGHLRQAVRDLLAERRGLAVTAEDVLITRGSQMALYLLARELIRPGDVVAVEEYGYPPAWRALREAGAELVPIPLDEHGLRVDRLRELCATRQVRALYVTPHHQYPTGAVLQAPRRLALLQLARQHRMAILEDDYDNEFHFEGRPVRPLASLDKHGVVIYIATLSKAFAPGVRIGWVVAPRALTERLVLRRRVIDRQGDQVVERAIAELLLDGTMLRHIRRMQRVAGARRDTLTYALREHLSPWLDVRPAPGGLALWTRVIDVCETAWAAAAERVGVEVTTAQHYHFQARKAPYLRLGFAACNEDELREAVRRLAAVVPGQP